MKLVHLADLHLGKRVNGFSMIEDQKYILEEILVMVEGEKIDTVLIAGDVYDKGVPSEQAVRLFDDFLCRLSRMGLQVYIISGNHDSEERVAFGGRLMDASGIHFAPVYNGTIEPMYCGDAYGKIAIWPIPFLKPSDVNAKHPELSVGSYAEALQAVVDAMPMDPTQRNIAISHQFIVGAQKSGSEDIVSVGGVDEVPVSVYEPFDYVALGHLHGPQAIGRETVRYSGSPLKYSFSEETQKKSVTVVELKEKGNVTVTEIPLLPRYELRSAEGYFNDFMSGEDSEDYLSVTLLDEEEIYGAKAILNGKYPNIMSLRYKRFENVGENYDGSAPAAESKSQLELFSDLYEKVLGSKPDEEQLGLMSGLIRKIWEG